MGTPVIGFYFPSLSILLFRCFFLLLLLCYSLRPKETNASREAKRDIKPRY